MKSKINKVALNPGADERLAALIFSPLVDKALSDRKVEIQAGRRKHVEAIAKINARELEERNKFDAAIQVANDVVIAAREALNAAENRYLKLTYERSSLTIESDRGRQIHQGALTETAPPEVADFIEEVRDIYEASLGYRALNHMFGYKRENYESLYMRFRTDAPAAQKWRELILSVLREAEHLPLEPDFDKIADRIAEMRQSIADAGKLEFTEVLVPSRNAI